MKRNLILSSLIITGLVIGCGNDDKKATPKKPQVKAEVTKTTEAKKPNIEDIDYLKNSLDNAQTEEDHAVRNTVAGLLEMTAGYFALSSANVDSKVSKAINDAKTDMVALAKIDSQRLAIFKQKTAPQLQASIKRIGDKVMPMNIALTTGGTYDKKLLAQLSAKIKEFQMKLPNAYATQELKDQAINALKIERNLLYKNALTSSAALKALPSTLKGVQKVSYKAVSSGQYARNVARGTAGKTVRLLVKGVAVVAIAEGATRIVMQFTDGIDWLSDYLPGNYVVRVLTGFTHSDRGDIPAAE